MAFAYQGVQALQKAGLAEELWTLRYRTFIEEMKWALPCQNRKEKDCYDGDKTTYLLSFDQNHHIKAGARLLPTTTSFLLEDVFDHLVDNSLKLPKGPTTVEFSQYFIRSDFAQSRDGIHTAGEVFCSIFEYCLNEGIDTMLAVVDTRILPQAYEMGWCPTPLGLPGDFGGGPSALGGGKAVAIKVDITQEALNATARLRHINLPALTSSAFSVDQPQTYSPELNLN